jgi:hypothetical protein
LCLPARRIIATTVIQEGIAHKVEGALRDYAERKEAHERTLEARRGFGVVRDEGNVVGHWVLASA